MGATKALIAAGCDSSVISLHGNTALHLACSKARWDVARFVCWVWRVGGTIWYLRGGGGHEGKEEREERCALRVNESQSGE